MSTVTNLRTCSVHTFITPLMSKSAVNAFNAAIGAASTDSGRYLLTKVQLKVTDNELKLVTTNSYRASRVTISLLDACPDTVAFLVDAKELKAALPKPSEFKATGTDRLTFAYYPGDREKDASQFHLTWGNNQRILAADPDGGAAGTYPNVEELINKAVAEKNVANEAVCYSPVFLGDIAKEAKLINKDRPVKVRPGSTPMQPTMFTTKDMDEPIYYESLLMPVREP